MVCSWKSCSNSRTTCGGTTCCPASSPSQPRTLSRIRRCSSACDFAADRFAFACAPNPNSSKSASSCSKCSAKQRSAASRDGRFCCSTSARSAAAQSACSSSIEGTFTDIKSKHESTNFASKQAPLPSQPAPGAQLPGVAEPAFVPHLPSPLLPPPQLPSAQAPEAPEAPPPAAPNLLTIQAGSAMARPRIGPDMKPKWTLGPSTFTQMPWHPFSSGASGGGVSRTMYSPGQTLGSGCLAQTASNSASTWPKARSLTCMKTEVEAFTTPWFSSKTMKPLQPSWP
mmetsp:Transcript_15117/g.41574  ORF Transcript_15117/g.41574 Transcript_15117/m.41574 type:complete len:284 (+) Transcript_15117:89-940(+)